jgi:hypothetical protein
MLSFEKDILSVSFHFSLGYNCFLWSSEKATGYKEFSVMEFKIKDGKIISITGLYNE